MEVSRFFRLLWRFNGIVIAVAGISAIGLMFFISVILYKDSTKERTTHAIVNIQNDADIKENWQLGRFIEIAGSAKIMIPLHSDQTFSQEYFSKSSHSTRNYLFLDKNTAESHWLFSHTDYLVKNEVLLKIGDHSSHDPVLAILYYLVKLDTNNDNRLSAQDTTTIALTKPDGSGFTEILSGVESVVGYSLLNEKEILLMYQKEKSFFTSKINIETGNFTSNTEIPSVGL